MTWFYLSFADEGFRGACIVRGANILEAVREANRLGCNPGGEVLGFKVPRGELAPASFRERLLNEAEARELGGGSIRETEN